MARWRARLPWLLVIAFSFIAPLRAAAQAQLEASATLVGSTPVTVSLSRTFSSPVVVCTIWLGNNSVPVVPRVSNVTATSFDVRLENPSGGAVVAEYVSYIVVEEGVWTIDGVKLEAQSYLSTVTDEDGSWDGEEQSYGQGYTNPVVLGQVMTENDANWSVFWCRGTGTTSPPSSIALSTGKTVCEDPLEMRADETVGFMVIEAGHGTLGGVAYEAALGADTVQGVDNGPPFAYNFAAAFGSAPQVGLASVAGMDGNNGAWAVVYGPTPTTTTRLYLAADEDQLADSERNHTDEQVGYLVFERPVLYPNQAPDDPAGLSLSECPQGGGTDKTPSLQFTQADGDGDPVTYQAQIDDTDGTFSSLVVDYESAALAGGAASFTVGQAEGGGSYSVGAAGQELAAGTYYWRVQSTDGFATSGWTTGASFTIVEPTIDFSSSTYAGGESGGAITVTVELSGDSCQTIEVDYDSSDGGAEQPDDYGAVSGTLTFAPGDTGKTFTVTPVTDTEDEGDETVTLTLSGPSDATLAEVNNPATLTIIDDDDAGVTIAESAGSTDVVEGGATDTYTVVLDTKPTDKVTITVTPDAQTDLGSGSGVPIEHVFTRGNWPIPQVVTVTAVDDAVVEGAHSSTITHAAASTDTDYNGMAVGDVTANITDNDTGGVTVSQTAGSTAVTEGGAADTYSVVLDSKPTDNVTITVDPDGQTDVGAGAGGTIQLTFTTGNWSVAQTVTVTAFDDDVVEGAHSSTITHSAASADGGYDGVAIANVTADVTDNDTAGVTVTESGGSTDVAEGGATDAYTVVLKSEPSDDVIITVTPDGESDLGAGAGGAIQLTFTAADWDSAQTVTVTAVDDGIDEGTHSSTITHSAASADDNYGGIDIGNITVSITDNDTAGVTITESGGSTDVVEGGATDGYTVVLDSRPTANVTITVDPDEQSDVGGGPGTAIELIFSTGTWSVAQTVTVAAVDDNVAEGAHVSVISHSSGSIDAKYDDMDLSGADVSVGITDDDVGGVTITESGSGTSVIEAGATDTYTIVLDSQPTDDVVITVDPDDQTDVGGGVDATIQLTFTPTNWLTPQVVTVVAFDDAIDEGGHTSTITHSAASTDDTYDEITIVNVVANVGDDDVAGVTVSESGGSTSATEGGATDTYTVVLDSEPTDTVTITVTPDGQTDLGAGAGVAIQLTFNGGNWGAAQPVTVTAYDDDVDEDGHISTITHVSASADDNYDDLSISDVVVNITDNDTAGVTITESAGSTEVTEGGATDAYEVVLDTEPRAVVTIVLDPDQQTDLGAGAGMPIQLTFNAGNWSTGQGVTVTAVDDDIDEGPHTSTIVHSVSSPDGKYDAVDLSGSDVVAAVADNDTAGITIVESGGSTDVTESGVVDSYTVVLDSEPTQNVTITITPDGQTNLGSGAGVNVQRSFTPGNWSVAQVVTVTAVNDAVAEGAHSSTITHAAGSSDAKYAGTAIGDVTANITDNDTADVIVSQTGGTTTVTEGGAADSYSVALDSEPTGDVIIRVDPDGQTDVGAGVGGMIQLTFTAGNWSTGQTVTVTAYDDDIHEGAHTSTITHAAASTDGNYDDFVIADVTVNVTDNDTAGVSITESDGSTVVTEGGATDTYTVVLESEPTGEVKITVTPDGESDLGAGAGGAIELTFTAADWDTPQTVTVTAVDDDVDVGDRLSTIAHAVGSVDVNYQGRVLGNVIASITEDDTAGVIVTETDEVTHVGEGGTTDSYAIVLNSRPLTDVLITAVSDGQTDLGAGPTIQLTFTGANWSTEQTIVVAAVDDSTVEGPHTSLITHTVLSSDDKYDGIAVGDVTVSITDDDESPWTPPGDGESDPPPEDDEPEPPEDDEPEPGPQADDEPEPPPSTDEGEEPSGDGSGSQPPDDDEPASTPPDDDGPEPDSPGPGDPGSSPSDDDQAEPTPEVRVSIETARTPVCVGDEVSFTVVVENAGEVSAADVAILLWLSDNGELLSARRVGWREVLDIPLPAAAASGEVGIALGAVPPGDTVELELAVRAEDEGTLVLAVVAELGGGVVSEAVAEVTVESVFDRIVVSRRPGRLCGAVGLGTLLVFAGLTLSRIGRAQAHCNRRTAGSTSQASDSREQDRATCVRARR